VTERPLDNREEGSGEVVDTSRGREGGEARMDFKWLLPVNKMNEKIACTDRYMESPRLEIRVERNSKI
jgi:hypothetical protein